MIEKIKPGSAASYAEIQIINKVNELIEAFNKWEENLIYLLSESASRSSESMDIDTSTVERSERPEGFDS
jgi:hypothetical protein